MLRRRVARLLRELRLRWADGILRAGLYWVAFISSMESVHQVGDREK